MRVEEAYVEYSQISEREGDELLYQVYELLIGDDMQDTHKTPTGTSYNQ